MRTIKELIRRVVVFILTAEARAVFKRHRPRVILVTGGVGKTLTKDAIYRALSGQFFVRQNEERYGGDLGIPLAILGLGNGWNNPFRWFTNFIEGFFLAVMDAPYPEWLVMEVSAERPGEIARSLQWIVPDVVVATRFPEVPSHVEFYASPEAVIAEELAPLTSLRAGGVFIANADDTRTLAEGLPAGVRRMTYGFAKKAEVRATRFLTRSHGRLPTGISFTISYAGSEASVAISGVAGEQHAYPVLAAVSAALAANVPLPVAAKEFQDYQPSPGRMRILPGMRGSIILDDSYNASPTATEEALAVAANIPRSGKRIAILGDMLELGRFSADEHRRIGALAAHTADVLVTAGVRARGIAEGAREAGMPPESVIECERGADAAANAVSLVGEGDVILVKGSQAMRMERVVKALMAEPDKAKELLVRQGPEWLRNQ